MIHRQFDEALRSIETLSKGKPYRVRVFTSSGDRFLGLKVERQGDNVFIGGRHFVDVTAITAIELVEEPT